MLAGGLAISMRTGTLKDVINRYKYEGQWTWAYIFGRVVAGFLDEQADLFREFDVITASPTYVGTDGRAMTTRGWCWRGLPRRCRRVRCGPSTSPASPLS